ncbi:MAG: biotin--[acetyl-CoA-carboxylase] ligase [Candidatus Eremiobacteraeota bacterium]|nr:biotin--[acetyl-CoA-carboxylase] ligase [Candidatus Eremiobacteraeota bacterium]
MQEFKLDPRLLRTLLTAKEFGSRIHFTDTIDSTNNKAKKLANEGAAHGTLVIAKNQVKGKGRFDREWLSPEGGLWFSVILRPPAVDPQPLTVIFGAAISMIIESQISVPCRFHWTNDLYINEKKVGGILMESRYSGENLDYIVAGVGINLNFPAHELGYEFPIPPTTILDERGEPTAPTALLAGILNRLEKDYNQFLENGPTDIIKKYKNRCITLGRRVKIINSGQIREADGYALDIADDGGLLVELFSGAQGVLYNAERLILMEKY